MRQTSVPRPQPVKTVRGNDAWEGEQLLIYRLANACALDDIAGYLRCTPNMILYWECGRGAHEVPLKEGERIIAAIDRVARARQKMMAEAEARRSGAYVPAVTAPGLVRTRSEEEAAAILSAQGREGEIPMGG